MAFTHPSIIVVSGPMGAGKTTIANLLAQQFERAAVINGGTVQQLIASGLSWPKSQAEADESGGEFARQLRTRLRGAATLAQTFVDEGITAIIEEQIVGDRVDQLLEDLAGRDFYFVMLAPRFDVVSKRERDRGTDNFARWGSWDDLLATGTREIGLWLDTSEQTVGGTMRAILHRADEARVESTGRPTLFLMCGLPCSGKTTAARQLAEEQGAIRLTPDEWMEPLYGEDRARLDAARYPVESIAWNIAAQALKLGVNAILDFGLLGRSERDDYRARAASVGARAEVVYLDVPREELLMRLENRNRELPQGALFVSRDLLERYWNSFERPTDDELGCRL